MGIEDAIEEYLTYLVSEKGDAYETSRSYRVDLYQFVKMTGVTNVKELTTDKIDNFILMLSEKGLARNTINKKAIAVKGLYRYLAEEGKIEVHLGDVSVPQIKRRLPETLSNDEIVRLFRQPDPMTYKGCLDLAMMELCYSCGLRVSELVDAKLSGLNVKESYIKVFGKESKERIVPIRKEALYCVKEYLEFRNMLKTKSKRLFLHSDNTPIKRQYFNSILNTYAKRAQITKRVHPHMLRHSFATTMIENGANLKQVQALLGHAKIETTQIYTHVSRKKIVEAYDKGMKR